jgi:acyl-coenzyme A synthetase/AMP-(fatty) acid ligase
MPTVCALTRGSGDARSGARADDCRVSATDREQHDAPDVAAGALTVDAALARGPMMIRGYRNLLAQTAEAIDQDRWLHTGDVATIDADGYLTIVDRSPARIGADHRAGVLRPLRRNVRAGLPDAHGVPRSVGHDLSNGTVQVQIAP